MNIERIRILSIVMMLLACNVSNNSGQNGNLEASPMIESVWDVCRQGEINEAMTTAKSMLEDDSSNSEARHICLLTSFLTGRYEECLAHYSLLDKSYEKYRTLDDVILDAYDHLGRIEDAAKFAELIDRSDSVCNWLDRRSKKPLRVELGGVTVIPFEQNNPIKTIMPAVSIEINGKRLLAHLDTGGRFLAMSPRAARDLGIEYQAVGSGIANRQETTISMGIVAEVRLGDATLANLPTAVTPALEGVLRGQQPEDLIIIGTSVFEQFMTTWDHKNMRLILSPRGNDTLREEHMELIPSVYSEVDFYTFSDHWLAAIASVGNTKSFLFLFDTGLGVMDPKGRQPALAINASELVTIGFDPVDPETQFVECPEIAVSSATSADHVILVERDHKFPDWKGRLDTRGNMTWGLMKTFVWTMDFDNNKWLLSSIETDGTPRDDVVSIASKVLRALTGAYEIAPGVIADITTDDQYLYVQLTGQPKNALTAEDELTYVIAAAGAKLVFARDASGIVTHFTLFQGGREMRAARIK